MLNIVGIRSISIFIDYYNSIWSRTFKVFKSIPQHNINWAPNPSAFTFADILQHIINLERYMFIETILNNVNRYPGHDLVEITSYEQLEEYLTNLFKQIVVILKTISDEDLHKRCRTPDNASISVWKWLRSMVEHHVHHRGQIYTYLNLIEAASPPLYGLTSEEVQDRAREIS